MGPQRGESPCFNAFVDAVETLMTQVLYQFLHLSYIWQDEEGHDIPYIGLHQHPAGQSIILEQVKFALAFDHGHCNHLACI